MSVLSDLVGAWEAGETLNNAHGSPTTKNYSVENTGTAFEKLCHKYLKMEGLVFQVYLVIK